MTEERKPNFRIQKPVLLHQTHRKDEETSKYVNYHKIILYLLASLKMRGGHAMADHASTDRALKHVLGNPSCVRSDSIKRASNYHKIIA